MDTIVLTFPDGSTAKMRRSDAPANSYFKVWAEDFPDETICPVPLGSASSFEPISVFLTTRRLPRAPLSTGTIELLEYLMLGGPESKIGTCSSDLPLYNSIFWTEEYLRAHLYEAAESNYFDSDTVGLTQITEQVWTELCASRSPLDRETLFNQAVVKPRPWAEVQSRITELCTLIRPTNEVTPLIAGGAALTCLCEGDAGDVDVFVTCPGIYRYQMDKVESPSVSEQRTTAANIFARQFLMHLFQKEIGGVTRTSLAITINPTGVKHGNSSHPKMLDRAAANAYWRDLNRQNRALETPRPLPNVAHRRPDIQLILRVYASFSEVLHGFDLDASCVGLDAEGRIWVTDRWLHAFRTGVNVFSFSRMSPSYSKRLVKYAWKGFKLYLPGFNRQGIDANKVAQTLSFAKRLLSFCTSHAMMYRTLFQPDGLRGIDVLLFMEARFNASKSKAATAYQVRVLAEQVSDYSPWMDKRNNFGFCSLETLIRSYSVIKGNPVVGAALEQLMQNNMGIPPDVEYLNEIWLEYIFIPGILSRFCPKINYYQVFCIGADEGECIDIILELPKPIYNTLALIRPWAIPQACVWKTVNAGEQFTGTFHPNTVDPKEWMCSVFSESSPPILSYLRLLLINTVRIREITNYTGRNTIFTPQAIDDLMTEK